MFWWICSLGWFAASTKWRIKFEIVRAGKIARVRQSERKREKDRKKETQQSSKEMSRQVVAKVVPASASPSASSAVKYGKMSECLSHCASVCLPRCARDRLLLMHTKYLCGISYSVPTKVDLFCQLSFYPPPFISLPPFAFLSSACHYAIDPTRSEYHILIIF